MSAELVFASVAISLALFFYTWGVFGERRGGTLSLKYVLLFWIGLACDTTGTLTMSNIASQSAASGFGIHAITGVVAIVLMLVHALWATFPAIDLQAVCAIGTSVIIVAILAVILFAKGRKKNDRGGKSRGTSPHAISH